MRTAIPGLADKTCSFRGSFCLSLLGRLDEADECQTRHTEAFGDPMVFLEGTFEIFDKPAYLQKRILMALETIPSGWRTA